MHLYERVRRIKKRDIVTILGADINHSKIDYLVLVRRDCGQNSELWGSGLGLG